MSDFCKIMHPLTRHVLWLTFLSQRRLPSFRTLRIRQTWPPAPIFSSQNLVIIYVEGDTIREMSLDLLFVSVWWVSPLKSIKYFQKLIDRLKRCVLSGGEYFEGQSKLKWTKTLTLYEHRCKWHCFWNTPRMIMMMKQRKVLSRLT